MPVHALLMRLFMIVALLASGPGIAGASMQMEHLRDAPGDASHVTAAHSAAAAGADCHGAEAGTPVTDDNHPTALADPAGAASPVDDCCGSADCCACMHHCSAAIGGLALADFTIRYRQTAEPLLSVPAFAALTNLFRPPIG